MFTAAADYLELIPLNERIVSFSRRYANSVSYHHWHQCLEILYVECGYGVIIVDNQQYTMRPGRLFIFPPYKLHKVLVEESQRELYQRTIIHLDNIVLYHFLRDFTSRRGFLQQLSHGDNPAAVYDLSDWPPRSTRFSPASTPCCLTAVTRWRKWPVCCYS